MEEVGVLEVDRSKHLRQLKRRLRSPKERGGDAGKREVSDDSVWGDPKFPKEGFEALNCL